jgi:hypothetical protein
MGFEQVYEYEDGKRDWGSFGLPREGTLAEQPSGSDVARADVPTCLLSDDLSEVRRRVRKSGWDTCIVVNNGGIVLARFTRHWIRGSVRPGRPRPSTVRRASASTCS